MDKKSQLWEDNKMNINMTNDLKDTILMKNFGMLESTIKDTFIFKEHQILEMDTPFGYMFTYMARYENKLDNSAIIEYSKVYSQEELEQIYV